MPNTPAPVRAMKELAKRVGGRRGKELSALVMAVSEPELGVRTRSAVASQYGAVLKHLGAYSPRQVPLDVIKKMRKDPQIRLALTATKAPIIEAPLWFDSPSQEAAALAEDVWLNSGVLRGLLRSSLQAVDFGFAAHEVIYEAKEQHEITWTTTGATVGSSEQKSKTFPIVFAPQRFKDLDPAYVTVLQDDFGRYEGLLYGKSGGMFADAAALRAAVEKGRYTFLPPEKSFLFTLNYEWDNPYGEGRCEWAYDPWYWQGIIYLICNRWYERKADPPYVGFAPADPLLLDPGVDEDFDYNEADENHAPIIALRRLLSRLRSTGEIVLPSEPYKGEDGKPSTVRAYDVKELGIEDAHPAFLAYIEHLDRKKVRACLMPDAAIMSGENSGTYGSTQAMAEIAIKTQNETHSDFLTYAQRYAIEPWRKFNGIKDKVLLRTGGISADNRSILKEILLKMAEADMLLEQSYGPQFPDSLPRLLGRKKLLRSLNVPFEEPDPNAPPPKVPQPIVRPDASSGAKANQSKTSGAKRSAGLSFSDRLKSAFRERRELDVASADFQAWAQRRADDFEDYVGQRAARAPYRETIADHEKAVAAILLWLYLRAGKTEPSGKKVKGSKSVDELVFEKGGTFKSAADLASVLPELEAIAKPLESVGLRLDPDTSRGLLARAETGIEKVLDGLPVAIETDLPPDRYLRPALSEAEAVFEEGMRRFDPSAEYVPLTTEDEDAILELNSRGLLWNIENIAIRNGRSAVERAINAMGNRRQLSAGARKLLGVVEEAATTRFNRLYSDLSLEAHLRAAFRAGLSKLGPKNGYPYLLMVSASGPDKIADPYAGEVKPKADWDLIGERLGAPNPTEQFGLHHGSSSYWFPVPTPVRVRDRAPTP